MLALVAGAWVVFTTQIAFGQDVSAGSPTTTRAAATAPADSQASEAEEEEWGGNILGRTAHDVHELLIDDTADVFRKGDTSEVSVSSRPPGIHMSESDVETPDGEFHQAVYLSREIRTRFPFNEVVPSWNVDVPTGAGFAVQLRMRHQKDKQWTDWYYLGVWGQTAKRVVKKHIQDESGQARCDYFVSRLVFDRLQYRFTLSARDARQGPVIRRVAMAYSNTLDDAAVAEKYRKTPPKPAQGKWARRLPVPYRSQTVEDPDIAHSICSPTSVSMVMEYRGVSRPTAEVAERIWDDEYRIFGNWGRAVQGAYTFGVPGYLQRFGNWEEVKAQIANGQPVIASIRVPKIGGLRGAPYRSSRGHLIVITGFDEHGHVQVNDPAAKTAEKGMITYFAEDLEDAWLNRGGLGYVLLPREKGS